MVVFFTLQPERVPLPIGTRFSHVFAQLGVLPPSTTLATSTSRATALHRRCKDLAITPCYRSLSLLSCYLPV